jgi:hypothetical protein
MCRYGAPGGAHLPTFCARVRCAEVERRSADMAGARDWFVLVDHRVLVAQLLLDSSGEMTTLRTFSCDSESITDEGLVMAKVPIVWPDAVAGHIEPIGNRPAPLRSLRGFAPVVGDAHGFPVF